MRVENITTPKNSIYNTEQQKRDEEIKIMGNRTALVLLSLSGLASAGLVGASLFHNKRIKIRNLEETIKSMDMIINNGILLRGGKRYTGKLEYYSKKGLPKTRVYENGLVKSVETNRGKYSTKLIINRDTEGKAVSYDLYRYELGKNPKKEISRQIEV